MGPGVVHVDLLPPSTPTVIRPRHLYISAASCLVLALDLTHSVFFVFYASIFTSSSPAASLFFVLASLAISIQRASHRTTSGDGRDFKTTSAMASSALSLNFEQTFGSSEKFRESVCHTSTSLRFSGALLIGALLTMAIYGITTLQVSWATDNQPDPGLIIIRRISTSCPSLRMENGQNYW